MESGELKWRAQKAGSILKLMLQFEHVKIGKTTGTLKKLHSALHMFSRISSCSIGSSGELIAGSFFKFNVVTLSTSMP